MCHLFTEKNHARERKGYPERGIRMWQCSRDSKLRASRAHTKGEFTSGRMREQLHNLDLHTGPKGSERDWKIAHKQKRTQCSQKLKESFYCTVLEQKDNAKSQVAWGQPYGDLIVLKRERRGNSAVG